MTIIARELLDWRRDFYRTQDQAADLMGVSVSSYQKFETGKRVPPLREWQRMRALMEVMYVAADIEHDGRTRR